MNLSDPVDDINPALPIIRNMYDNYHSLASFTVWQDLYHQPSFLLLVVWTS